MKNKSILFVITTVLLFLLSMLCFRIMRIKGQILAFDPTETVGGGVYYFNTIFALIGLVLYNILKITYDRIFNKIYKSYIKRSKRIIMWILYIVISLIFWVFVFINSNIGGALTDLYQFKVKILQGLYAIDLLFVLPLWNIVYNIIIMTKNKIVKETK